MMKYTVLVVALAAILSACAHKPMVNTIANAEQTGRPQRVVDQRVYLDAAFGETLWLEEIRESKTNDGFKRIQLFLKNYADAPYTFSYRVNWYDQDGVEVETADDEMWKKVHAMPGDDVTLTSIAPTKACVDFKVRIISRH